MKLRFFQFILPSVVIICLTAWQQPASLQGNTTPKVSFTKPSPNYRFNWNTLISYSIAVADKEDGMSAYDEISTNEVYLKIRYVPDSAKIKTHIASEAKPEAPALTFIKSSGCFNCHAFKNKLIGPSFETMAKQHAKQAKCRNLTLPESG